METSTDLKHLRARFVSDMNIPIQVLQSPYFEDRLELLEEEYGALTSYTSLLALIVEKFDGKPTNFLEYYHQVRDEIITKVTNSNAYKEFISDDSTVHKHDTI